MRDGHVWRLTSLAERNETSAVRLATTWANTTNEFGGSLAAGVENRLVVPATTELRETANEIREYSQVVLWAVSQLAEG